MTLALLALLLALLLATPAAAEPTTVRCARTGTLVHMLQTKHQERPLLWRSPDVGVLWGQRRAFDGVERSWSIVAHRSVGVSCILASGQDLPPWVDDLDLIAA